jgi:hypothetical protein
MFNRQSAREVAAEARGMAQAANDHAQAATTAAQQAAATSQQSLQEIRAHQAACIEQNKGVNDSLNGVKSAVKNLYWLGMMAAGTLICGMAGLIVTLVLLAFPHAPLK